MGEKGPQGSTERCAVQSAAGEQHAGPAWPPLHRPPVLLSGTVLIELPQSRTGRRRLLGSRHVALASPAHQASGIMRWA